MKVGDTVMIRGDRRTAGKYTPDQLVNGKYVKKFGTNEPWTGKVREVSGDMVLVDAGWRGIEMYEVTQ